MLWSCYIAEVCLFCSLVNLFDFFSIEIQSLFLYISILVWYFFLKTVSHVLVNIFFTLSQWFSTLSSSSCSSALYLLEMVVQKLVFFSLLYEFSCAETDFLLWLFHLLYTCLQSYLQAHVCPFFLHTPCCLLLSLRWSLQSGLCCLSAPFII